MDLYGHGHHVSSTLHSKKCIHIHRNGTFSNGKVLYVQIEWDMDQLLSIVSQRLELVPQATRIYNSDGIEIEDTIMIEDQSHIFVSTGAEFLSPFLNPTTHQEEKPGEIDHNRSFDSTDINEKSTCSIEDVLGREHKSSIYSTSPGSYKSHTLSESKFDDREEKTGWEYQYEMKSNQDKGFDGNGNRYDISIHNEENFLDNSVPITGRNSEKPISPISQSGTKGIPPIVGGYVVGEMLGRGGFGEVRLGCHQLTQEKVAIKFLNKSTAIANMGAAERATTEIQCLMELNHQNIIRLLQQFDTSKYLVMVFELMEGGDLQHHLSEKIFFSEDEARPIFHQIVSAVSYAHNHHICHRDLKLENILICKSTSTSHSSQNIGSNQIKIADFGLSDFYSPGATRKSQCGSFAYLAPEIFKGTSNAGPPIDVWALGVILFSMLCGRLPFEADQTSTLSGSGTKKEKSTATDELHQIRSKIVKCQYKVNENLSPEAKDLIRRILKVNVMERLTVPEIITHVWFRSKDNNCLSGNGKGINSNIRDLPAFESKVEDDLKLRRTFKSKDESNKNNFNIRRRSFSQNEGGSKMDGVGNSRYSKHEVSASGRQNGNKKINNTANVNNQQNSNSSLQIRTSTKQVHGHYVSYVSTEGNNPSIMFDAPLMVTSPTGSRLQTSRNRNSNSISPTNGYSIFGNDLFESQGNATGGNGYSSFHSVTRGNGSAFDFDRDQNLSSSLTTDLSVNHKRGHMKRSSKSSCTYKNSISPKLAVAEGNNNKGRNYRLDEKVDQDESKAMERHESLKSSLNISRRLPPVNSIIHQSPSSKKSVVNRSAINKLAPLIGNEEETNYRGYQPSIGSG